MTDTSPHPTEAIPGFYNDLAASFEFAWNALENAATDRRSPMRMPVLGSTGLDGSPQVRTVVLRDVSRAGGRLRIHTDTRSRKVEELKRDPRCCVLAYDPVAGIQLRLSGTATIHTEDRVADKAWQGSRAMSLACYAQDAAPGDVLADPATADTNGAADLELGRCNFAAILMQLESIEWLYLHISGHRRALWQRSADDWSGTWLAP